MNYHNNVNKYVCPNDRQLQLRAKLRTGWSAARSQPPLTASERERIAAVVARAERLEALEARRVGRLVARAARAAAGRAPAAGGCTLCGRRARLLAPLRVCALCAAPVCGRCVIENGAHRDQYLCTICAETRELWKKSGAWFFKSLPAYVLPEKRVSGRQEGGTEGAALPADTDAGNTPPDFSRQSSAAESYKGAGAAYQEPNQLDSWSEIDTLHHGISALSLNRAESFSQKSAVSLKRTSSKGSAYSLRNYRKEIQKPPITPPADKTSPSLGSDAGLGTLEIRLFYDNSTSSLACTVMRARGLPGMDLAGLSDPFCRLDILPTEGTCSNRLRTKTVHKTKNPEFNETLNFYGITETDLSSKTLQIKVFDDDRYGCDIMGSTTIALRDLAIRGSIQQDLKLALSVDLEPPDSLPKPQILLSLSYNTKRRALVVNVCRCTNLPPMDSNGYSDPFIKLHLDPDPAHKKHKTSIKWRNLNPVYNEEFHFETRPTELTKQNLTLTVWDKDYGKANDFLGSLLIGSSSKGKRLKHWLDCIRFPDHRHEQWHSLTDTEHL